MKKKLMSLVLAMTMILSALPAAAAVEKSGDSHYDDTYQEQTILAKVRVTHQASGTTYLTEVPLCDYTLSDISENINSNGELAKTVSYKISINPLNAQINPLASESGSKEKENVEAYVKVTYTLSADKNFIKVSNFSGGWTYDKSIYYLGGREIGVHSGTSWTQKSLHEYISTDTFNYALDWGYVDRAPNGYTQARAWSEATIYISGMEDNGIFLSLELPFAEIESE